MKIKKRISGVIDHVITERELQESAIESDRESETIYREAWSSCCADNLTLNSGSIVHVFASLIKWYHMEEWESIELRSRTCMTFQCQRSRWSFFHLSRAGKMDMSRTMCVHSGIQIGWQRVAQEWKMIGPTPKRLIDRELARIVWFIYTMKKIAIERSSIQKNVCIKPNAAEKTFHFDLTELLNYAFLFFSINKRINRWCCCWWFWCEWEIGKVLSIYGQSISWSIRSRARWKWMFAFI